MPKKQSHNRKQFQKVIDFYKDIALSDTDVLNLVDGKANIITYPALYKIKQIDQILQPFGCCVLLFEAQPHFGHWCCLLLTIDEDGQDSLEFFDPYGGPLDSQIDHIPEPFRRQSHQDVPYLSYLLVDSPYRLSYNQYQFQKLKEGVKDCGRWSALRILFRHLPLEQFKDWFYGKNSDDIVTYLTMDPSQIKR
jgi:hypothetical protein